MRGREIVYRNFGTAFQHAGIGMVEAPAGLLTAAHSTERRSKTQAGAPAPAVAGPNAVLTASRHRAACPKPMPYSVNSYRTAKLIPNGQAHTERPSSYRTAKLIPNLERRWIRIDLGRL
jgi:hypothetical protein